MKKLDLCSDEIRMLEAILSLLSERTQHSLSLDNLIEKWRRFVIETEQGYEDSIYEYTNDLSIRDILEEVLLYAPQSLRGKLAKEIEIWDIRFQKATVEAEKPLVSRLSCNLPWWWFRIPKKLAGELEADLREMGIIS